MLDTPTRTADEPSPATGGLFDNAIIVRLELRRLGTRRHVDAEDVNKTDAAAELLHVSKDILESPELELVQQFDKETRRLLAKRTLPTPFRTGGFYAVPDVKVQDVDQWLTGRVTTRTETLVPAFLLAYQDRQAAAPGRLGSLYDADDYPPVDMVATTFSMRWSYLEFGVPGRLNRLSSAIARREFEKAQIEVRNTVDECRAQLCEGFATLIGRVVERLTPDADDKPKRFNDTLFANITEFLAEVDALNTVAGSAELAAAAERARVILGAQGGNAKRFAREVRSDEAFRAYASQAFGELAQAVSGWSVVKRGGRRIYS